MSTSTTERTLKDIMIFVKQFPTIYRNFFIKNAVSLMNATPKKEFENACGILLVLDDKQNWVGVIDRKMILRSIRPHNLQQSYCQGWDVVSYNEPVFWPGLFSKYCIRELVKKVEEIMYPKEVITIGLDDTLMKAVHLITEGEVESLVVVENEKAVGLVRACDIFSEIARVGETLNI